VFDIDGVLVDASRRLREAKRMSCGNKERFWKLFLSEELLSLDEPREIGIRLLLDRLKRGKVVLLTGRPESLRSATISQLETYGVPMRRVTALLMRQASDRRKEWTVKPELLREYASLHRLSVVEIHDDEPRTLDALHRIYPQARLVLHKGKKYYEYRPSSLLDFL